MPIPFILLLLLISILVWRRRSMAKYLVSCAFFVLLFLSSQLGVNTLVRPLESAYPINSTPIRGACFVMVLGSAHSDIQGATAVQSLSAVALARRSEGVRQLNLGQECKLIVSGWGGELTQFSHAHMPRAMAIFTAKGLHPEAAPTDFIGRDDFWWRLTADNLVASQRAIHEYIGRLWLWLKTIS